jgi:AcrR family transcriptional regulator
VPRPRASIDTAALVRAFAAEGLHGTPIERVVEACGVAKPTLYARGGDKDELFALAVEAEVERLLDRLDGPPARALDDHLRESPAGMRLLLVTGRVGSPRAEAALERLFAAVDPALLGAAYVALHGGPSVLEFARSLPEVDSAGPPAGIWTA